MIDISIIIPIHNVENYLVECLASVEKFAKQTDSEVLLVDDGSTDRSPEIAQEFCDRNSKFRYMRIEQKGVSVARNLGLENAQGNYIMFVDADDIIIPEVYREMLDIALSNELPLIRCNYVRIQNGNVLQSQWANRAMSNVKNSIATVEENPNLVYDTPSWNKIIKKSIFDEHSIKYPEGVPLNEDAPVMLKVMCHSKQCATYYKTGYLWRIRTDNIGGSATQNTNKEDAFLGKLETTKECLDFCKKSDIDSKVYKKVLWKFLSQNNELEEFIRQLPLLDEDESVKRIAHINSFLELYNPSEIKETLPIAIQQMLTALKNEDVEALSKIANFRIADIPSCHIVYEEGKEAEMIVPNTLFGTDRTPAKKEFTDTTPSVSITHTEITDDCLLMHGHVFQNRVETSEKNPQAIDAYLLNCKDNRRIELVTEIEDTRYLTQQKGVEISRWDYSAHRYDYDCGGFKIIIDPTLFLSDEMNNGWYSLHIAYRNSICEGAIPVRGTSANAKAVMKKWCVKKNGKQVTTWIDKNGIVFIKVEKEKGTKNKKKKKTKTIASMSIGEKYKISIVRK